MSTPASSASEASSGTSIPTGQLLEKRSMEIIESVNTLNIGYVFSKYASRDFVGVRELIAGTVSGFSLATTISWVEGFGDTFPNYHVNPMPASVDLDEYNGMGTVWVTCLLKHGPGGFEKETISIFHWRRNPLGDWECYKHTLLNGMPPIPR